MRLLSSAYFFTLKNNTSGTLPDGLGPDQDQCSVGPGLH